MSRIILHHYPGSPYAEKIRRILGHKQLAWDSVEISEILPRPQLMALTGGHRRSPVLQIGADVYCDTRCIALRLEELAPEPTLFPAGSRGLCALVSEWVEPRVFLSTGPVRFQDAGDVTAVFGGRVSPVDFAADRAAFMAPALDIAQMAALRPAALDQLRCFFAMLDGLLADGRPFLAGERVSLADFSAVHTHWFLERARDRTGGLGVSEAVRAWAGRIGAIGHGRPRAIRAQEALERARAAEPDLTPQEDPGDPAGRKPGDAVRIAADDYGTDAVEGLLVRLRPDTVSIVRHDPALGRIMNHFPRIGFRVLSVQDAS